ncbi:MAG: molybdopterin-dependent oxidoreductase, partial [Gemmatimonadales bacterium]
MTTRREFLYAIGAAGTAASLNQAQDVFWEPEQTPNLGWTPGIEQHVRSTCLTCPGRCGIRGRVVDGKLVSIAGNRLHPMNRGGLCPRGVAGVQKLYHPERLEGPLMRTGERGSNGWRRLSTNGAITLIAERLTSLRESGNPASLGLLAGYCKGTMEDLWKQVLHAFGSPNYVADDYFDGTDAVMGLMHGIHKRPAYDLDNAELVVSFGAPLFESWWSPLQAFVAFAPPEAEAQLRPRFVQIDTRFSKTAARSQEWVGIRPGTHAVLALGIAYVLIRDSIFDRGFVERFVTGFEDFERGGRIRQGFRSLVMSNYRTEEVSAITGVPVGRITDLARMIGEVEQPVAICGADVMQSPRGLLAGMAVHSLNVLTGSVRRRGGVIFREDTPLATLVPPTIDTIATAGNRSERVGAMNPPMDHDVRADRFAQAVTAGTESPIEALFLYYANPLASTKHPALWVQALQRIPFVVSFSPFMDETSRQADLILPDLFPYERWQDAPAPDSYPYPVWSITRPLVEPHEGAINTGDAVLQLATAIGGTVAESLPYQTMEALLKDRARGLFEVRRGMVF